MAPLPRARDATLLEARELLEKLERYSDEMALRAQKEGRRAQQASQRAEDLERRVRALEEQPQRAERRGGQRAPSVGADFPGTVELRAPIPEGGVARDGLRWLRQVSTKEPP